MKITIGNTTYTEIKNLSFAPETDVIGDALPINQFSVSLITTDIIRTGVFAALYDDADTLWAKYWVTTADKVSDNQIDVVAQSLTVLLERITLAPVMYSAETVTNVVADIFASVEALYPNSYVLDASFAQITISGYAPEQTARERLQWVCFVIGAYVKSYFSDKIEILPVDDTETLVPIGKTFWRPNISYDDYVTAIKAKSYTYTQGTPGSTDEWVEVNGTYYIQTTQDFVLQNPDVPITAPVKELVIDDLTLLNSSNISDVLTRASTYYFKRGRLSADIINNADHSPGERVIIYTDSDSLMAGFIKSCTFTFGLQAKATVELSQTDAIDADKVIVWYWCGDARLGKAEYLFPIDYTFTISNPYLDITDQGYRRIYRPLTETVSGTVVAGGVEVNAYYEIALEYHNGYLKMLSVDGVEQNDNEVEVD